MSPFVSLTIAWVHNGQNGIVRSPAMHAWKVASKATKLVKPKSTKIKLAYFPPARPTHAKQARPSIMPHSYQTFSGALLLQLAWLFCFKIILCHPLTKGADVAGFCDSVIAILPSKQALQRKQNLVWHEQHLIPEYDTSITSPKNIH